MKYKKSRFNVEVDKLLNGNILIYNTYTGVFGIMNTATQEVFRDIESFNASNSINDEMQKNIRIMLRSGYIVDFDKDELASLKLERARFRHPENSLNITIAPTMDCNMRCPYCFENKSDLVMSQETQDKLIDFIRAHFKAYAAIKNLSVVWYGGEPLMQKEVIYSLSEKLIELCAEKEIDYFASMITNGALLDLETAKKLAQDCKVSSIQVTMDGMKEQHNKRRVLINGEDSFETIVSNIENCKDFLAIRVRINVDKGNIADINKLTQFFHEKKGWINNPTAYLAPVEDMSEYCLIGESECLSGEEFAKIDMEFTRKIYAADKNSFAHRFYPKRSVVFCAGESTLKYVIDPQGYIYNCYIPIGEEKKRTGHIEKPFVVNEEYGKWLLADIPNKCEPCEYLPICMGGCGYHRINGDGLPQCFKTYYTYKDTLKLAYEDYVAQKSIQS